MEDTSNSEKLNPRDRAYYRRRQQNRVFEVIVTLFASEAERRGMTKKKLAAILGKDPAQITRWLSSPANLELDTISDILLAMGSEMDYEACRFEDRQAPNYVHPVVASCLRPLMITESSSASIEAGSSAGSAAGKVTVRALTPNVSVYE